MSNNITNYKTRNLTIRYLIALSLIALLSISAYVLIELYIHDMTSDASVINLSGRQRMLSQKLTKELLLAIQLQSPELKEQYFRQLKETEAMWSRVHIGLQKGDDELNLPGKNSKQVDKLFVINNPYYQKIKQAVDIILQSDSTYLAQMSMDSPIVQDIVETSTLFLRAMDSIVFQYDKEAQARVDHLKRLEASILVFLLVVLVSVGVFIFRPAVKAVQRSHDELEIRVERRTAELATANESLRREIKERERAEDSLRKSEKNFRNIFQNVPESLLAVNDQFEVLNSNKAFEELIRKYATVLNMSGEKLRTKIFSELREHFGKTLRGTIEIGNRMNKLILDFESTGKLFAAEEEEEAIVVSLKDITERVEARKNLEDALERAKQADKVKTLFLADMSHEIRTPLNAILGFTDLIKQSTSHLLSSEEQSFFKTIEHSGERLMRTVHEILDISQIETGTLDLNPEILSLNELTEKTLQAFKPLAENKGLELSYHSEIENAFIKVDEYCITQAISNVIDNAIKYTEKGEIEVSLTGGSNHILKIKDTGIGMSEEYITRSFELFSQESTGYTKKFQGIGLGLALTKRYLNMNNVDIDIESKKGVGTTVTLTFKSVEKPIPEEIVQVRREPTIHGVEGIGKKPLVLVVEDDPNSQTLTKFFLKEKYDTCFAVSVYEAKEQLRENSVDLILLDLSLIGDEDGLDLTRYLRKTKKWQDIPIIALTAHAFTTDRDNCLDAGCNDYLAKPIKRKELLKMINEFV